MKHPLCPFYPTNNTDLDTPPLTPTIKHLWQGFRTMAFRLAIAPPLLLLGLGLLPAIPTETAIAQSCQEPMGQAVTGAPVQLDACSFNRVSLNSVNFTDYLGNQKINAQVHCPSRTWTTFHDQVTHPPQS